MEEKDSPGQDDEAVEAIPSLGQIAAFTPDAHGNHLDKHLDCKIKIDDVVANLKSEKMLNICFVSFPRFGLTLRILHLLVSQTLSSHGWNMPSVTQLRRITVIVKRSNHLE